MYKFIAISILSFLFNYINALESVSITGVKPIPAKVVEGSTVKNISYNVHNNSNSNAFQISFIDLNKDGIKYTTTCGSLGPGDDCKINMTFSAPSLNAGETSRPYIHWFGVKGAPKLEGYTIQSAIIKSGGEDVTPEINISLNNSGVTTTTNSYDVQLSLDGGGNYNCQDVVFGETQFCQSIPKGQYSATIMPASVPGSDSKTYDAPKSQEVHIAKNGQEVNYIYTENKDESVTTNLTMPNAGAATSAIECKGEGQDYGPHDQASGSNAFDTMIPGSYTCTATEYTGTDTETYVPALNNPYTINDSSTEIAITYESKGPTEHHVKTDITAPNLQKGKTVSITLADATNTYGPHNQPAGTATFDTVEDATDYTLTCDDYTVGPDKYSCTPSNPYTVDSGNTTISITYKKEAPAGHQYDWHQSHLDDIKNANIFAIYWGGGSTTAPVHIGTNPPINPWLNSALSSYESGTPTAIGPNATVQEFPAYIAMGTVTESTTDSENQLKNQKLDASFHYEGNGAGDRGCFWDEGAESATCTAAPYGYTPEVPKMADQADAVKASTGHTLIPSEVFYTIDFSDGATAIEADTENDANLTRHLYNLMYEAQIMQAKQQAGTPMALFLNPDSTWIFQNCAQWYCPLEWKPGLTQDTKAKVVYIPNLKEDTEAALDRMQTKGYLTDQQVTTMKSSLESSGILTPPAASKRTNPGLPELVLVNNWIMKELAPNVPFGWGINAYDNNNPILNPDGKSREWQTGSITWIHKINHLGYDQSTLDSNIQLEATKLANWLKDMNMVGNAAGDYKPDFIYFDKYERDPIPGYVSTGFAFNGADWDTYLKYMADTDSEIDNLPVAIWQMPGSSLQITGATFTGDLAATVPNWVFGTPELNNDFSNIASELNLSSQQFTSNMNTSVYFTKNSKVNNLEDYLKLGSGSP